MHDIRTVEIEDRAYRGLRMTADEFLALPEDDAWYELVDGVVCMSPSPSFRHQKIVFHLGGQFSTYLQENPIGEAVSEIDVRFGDNLVYRPDFIFLSNEKAARCENKITEVPDLIVEIISPDSRSFDSQTKKGDYEAVGVREYWLIDPIRKSFHFYRLQNGRFSEIPASGEKFRSEVLTGFELDLLPIRKLF